MSPPAVTREAPPRRRRVPPAMVALVIAATALLFAALAIVAGRAGPLVAHPPDTSGPPGPITGAFVSREPFSEPPAWPSAAWSAAWLWWIGVTLLALIGVALVWWLVQALRGRSPRPATTPVLSAAPQAIDAMLGSLAEPAEADLGDARTFVAARAADDIIASWEIVERAAAARGLPRRATTTPTEFLQELVAVIGDAATPPGSPACAVLLGLYHRARFDVVALTPGAATRARSAAAVLVERLSRHRPAGEHSRAPAPGGHR